MVVELIIDYALNGTYINANKCFTYRIESVQYKALGLPSTFNLSWSLW